jgi:WD40 repeat protein
MTRSTLALALGTCLTAAAAPNLKGDPRFPGAEAFGEVRLSDERMPAADLTIAPGGAEIIFFGYNRAYYLYDVASARVVREVPNDVSFHDITFSPDGKVLAAAEWWAGVKLRDPKSGEVRDTLKPEAELGAFCATFLPSGKLAAYCWKSQAGAGSAMKEQLAVWDPGAKQRIGWDVTERTEANGQMIRRWFVGPGRHLLSMETRHEKGAIVARSLTLTDPATNKESKAVELDPDDFVCDTSPDGGTLIVSSRKSDPRLVEVATGKVTQRLTGGHKQMVTCGAFSPDGKRVATASGSRTRSNPSHFAPIKADTPTEIILWDPSTGKKVAVATGKRRTTSTGSGSARTASTSPPRLQPKARAKGRVRVES